MSYFVHPECTVYITDRNERGIVMIDKDNWIRTVERELNKMKQGDEQQTHASMYAIALLCEAGLQRSGVEAVTPSSEGPVAAPLGRANAPSSLDGNILQERDANGSSLFDF